MVGGGVRTYFDASNLCSWQRCLNWSRCESWRGGFSHLRWDLRKRANALPLGED